MKILGWILAIVILVATGWFFYWLFTSRQDIVIGLIAGLTPSAITIWQYREQAKKEHKNWLLRNREACLVEIIDIFVSSIHESKKANGELKQEKMLERFEEMQPAMFAHAGAQTLQAWNEFQNQPQGESLDAVIRRGERFFRTIRKDLGRCDAKLKPGELWATLLKPEDKQQALDACKGETYE